MGRGRRRAGHLRRPVLPHHIRFPVYHPAVIEVLVARDGAAWLRLPDEDGATPWIRLGADGAEDLRLSLPSGFRAAYADADALWGEMCEPDRTLRLVAYPLPGRPPLVPPSFAGLRLTADQPPPPASLIRGRC